MEDYVSELSLEEGKMACLPRVSEFVHASCAQAHVDPSVWFDLNLAVEEACTNVIEHAYGGAGGEITVRFEARGADVCISVMDHGQPFDPDAVILPDLDVRLEDRRIGGLGLLLMQRLMDDVRFTFSAEGNKVELVKRRVRTETD